MRRRDLLVTSAAATLLDFLVTSAPQAALLPPPFLQCVVAIGFTRPQVGVNGQIVSAQWQTIGTGFFWGKLIVNDPDLSKRLYATYLVTAWHVIDDYDKISREDNSKSVSALKVRIDPASPGLSVREVALDELADQNAKWIKNPNGKDIGVVAVDLKKLRDSKYESAFYPEDIWAADVSKMKDIGASEGDEIYVLGFPMGLSGAQRNYVIVKQGIIARMAEIMDGAADYFMIDSLIFPGNSGGPVILRPEGIVSSITGTKSNNNAYLIGVVVANVPYTEAAVSQQTGRPRVEFEENSGLAIVLPVNFIHDAVEAAQVSAPPAAAPANKVH